MQPTPLQTILGLSLLGRDERLLAELILAMIAGAAAFALRGRRRTVRAPSLVMCACGFLFDLVASPRFAPFPQLSQWASALGLLLVFWGIIKMLLDAVDAAAHRSRAHFSTIFKELLMILLFAVVAMAVLTKDVHVDPTPLLASSAVVGVVLGFALQESLGNVFSGLTLQLGKPFSPGDWIRSGNFIGRVQGIGWRATAVITRANERLEIPNSLLAKEAVINYSNGAVADDVLIGLSYDAPPNYVHQVITDTLRGVPGLLQHPAPEIFTLEYGDSGIKYRVKYWMSDYAEADRLHDTVMTSLWYALRRKAIEIPYPVMTLRTAALPTISADAQAFEQEIISELRQVDFLRNLRDEELRLLMPGVTVLKFGTGETIVREGDEGNSLYIIRSGTVQVVAAANTGREVHIRDLRRPAFFGEMALMTGEPRNATIRARTDAELLELSRDGFTQLFKLHPETAAKMGDIIALRMTERRELLDAAPGNDGARSHANWLLAKISAVFNLSLAN